MSQTHVGICSKRHDTDMVCVWRHKPYVADMIFCVANTVDDMSLCRVDWAQKKNDTTPTFPAKAKGRFCFYFEDEFHGQSRTRGAMRRDARAKEGTGPVADGMECRNNGS